MIDPSQKNYYNDAMKVIEDALANCDDIEDRVREDPDRSSGELPEAAGEFVEQVKPKLISVQEYGKRHMRVTFAQHKMVRGIYEGLENWLPQD